MVEARAQAAARWAEIRRRTPVTERYAYMNCGWSGPLSTTVVEAMQRRIDLELHEGPTTRTAMDDKRALTERLKAGAARMLGADPDEIAITGNTTEGVNIAVNGLDLRPGDRVVTTNVEHGGGMIPAYWARERRGADLAIVPVSPDAGAGELLERFDQALGDRAGLVVLSEISYATGQALPLRQITELAHARGATVVVDGAQTAGHIPIDVHALGVDAYAIPSHKWLCGPDGLGLLYVRRDRIADLDPVKVSHRAAAVWDGEGNFAPLRDQVTKFEVSTMSTPVMAGTLAAIDQYLDLGPAEVWDRVRDLNRHAEARFDAIDGVEVTSPRSEDARTGLFCFKTQRSGAVVDPAVLSAYLQGEGRIVCRTVKQRDSVRLSLHVYNTEEEVDRAAALVALAAREGVPERYMEQAKQAPPEA